MYNEENYRNYNELDNVENEDGSYDLETFLFLEPVMNKGEKCCNLVAFLDFQNDGIDAEIKRLQELKKRNIKKIESVKNYLLYLSESNSGLKMFGTRKITIRHTKAVEIKNDIDMSKVPEDFKTLKITEEIDKKKVREYLEQPLMVDQETGEVIPNHLDFAELKENTSVTVK